jgi:hypothetical protein
VRVQPWQKQQGGFESLGRELVAEFKTREDYDLEREEAAELVAQLRTLGVKRIQVPKPAAVHDGCSG